MSLSSPEWQRRRETDFGLRPFAYSRKKKGESTITIEAIFSSEEGSLDVEKKMSCCRSSSLESTTPPMDGHVIIGERMLLESLVYVSQKLRKWRENFTSCKHIS